MTFWRSSGLYPMNLFRLVRASYLPDSFTTFQHLALTTVSVCSIMGSFFRHQ